MNPSILHAFKSRNYRLYFIGQSISLLGTWMQKTAVSWVIYAQTQSKFMLGVSVFATLFPSAVFSTLGGVVSDRFDRYRVLLVTQALSMMQAIALTLVVYFRSGSFEHNTVWAILSLSVVLGVINGFDMPARQAMVYDLVEDKKDLPNAVALNSSMVNLAKLIGPALAGIAIERLGETVCFGLNAASFVGVIGSVLLIRLPAHPDKPHAKNLFGELAEGFDYVRRTPRIRFVLLMLALVSLLVLPFTTLMPVYARDVFEGTASTFGLIDSAIGLMLFAYTPWYAAALCLIALAAFGMMSQITISNTILQTQVKQQMRGRVISLYLMVYSSALPLGGLLVGAVSHYAGVRATVLGEGALALLLGGFHVRYLHRARLRADISPVADAPSTEVALHS